MSYDGPATKNAILDGLTTLYDKPSATTRILLNETDIGRVVTYGKKDTLCATRMGLRPTVFNGRVQVNSHRFSVEASSVNAMLNKLAVQISRALRDDRKSIVLATEEPSPIA
jgi:hypothetical protein